jgi:hypothetical protein
MQIKHALASDTKPALAVGRYECVQIFSHHVNALPKFFKLPSAVSNHGAITVMLM